MRQIGSLPITQLAAVLDRLLHPRDVGADLVVPPLDRGDTLALVVVKCTLLLDRRFGGALISKGRLHRKVALAHRRVVNLGTAIEVPQLAGRATPRSGGAPFP